MQVVYSLLDTSLSSASAAGLSKHAYAILTPLYKLLHHPTTIATTPCHLPTASYSLGPPPLLLAVLSLLTLCCTVFPYVTIEFVTLYEARYVDKQDNLLLRLLHTELRRVLGSPTDLSVHATCNHSDATQTYVHNSNALTTSLGKRSQASMQSLYTANHTSDLFRTHELITALLLLMRGYLSGGSAFMSLFMRSELEAMTYQALGVLQQGICVTLHHASSKEAIRTDLSLLSTFLSFASMEVLASNQLGVYSANLVPLREICQHYMMMPAMREAVQGVLCSITHILCPSHVLMTCQPVADVIQQHKQRKQDRQEQREPVHMFQETQEEQQLEERYPPAALIEAAGGGRDQRGEPQDVLDGIGFSVYRPSQPLQQLPSTMAKTVAAAATAVAPSHLRTGNGGEESEDELPELDISSDREDS